MQNESTINQSILALWEIASVLISCLIAEWVVPAFLGPSKLALGIPVALALALMIFSHRTYGETLHDLGFRLDHLLCSPEAADRLQGAGVDKWARGEEKASDHAPTWIRLN